MSSARSRAAHGRGKKFKNYEKRVARINAFEPELELLTDDASCARRPTRCASAPREGASRSTTCCYECFALVREAGRRTMGMRHFDVQLIGGMVLHDGSIAEMKTGEGKTLTATLPSSSTRSPARASTSSRSTTTWPGATPSG